MIEHPLITSCRQVLSSRQYVVIDCVTGTVCRGDADSLLALPGALLLDLQSANMVVTIYDNLSEEKRLKIPGIIGRLGCAGFVQACQKLWSIIK